MAVDAEPEKAHLLRSLEQPSLCSALGLRGGMGQGEAADGAEHCHCTLHSVTNLSLPMKGRLWSGSPGERRPEFPQGRRVPPRECRGQSNDSSCQKPWG